MTNGEAFKQMFGKDIEDLICKGTTGVYEWADSAAFIIHDDEGKPKKMTRSERLEERYSDPFYIASTQNELAIMNVTLARFLDLLEERWKIEDDSEEN